MSEMCCVKSSICCTCLDQIRQTGIKAVQRSECRFCFPSSRMQFATAVSYQIAVRIATVLSYMHCAKRTNDGDRLQHPFHFAGPVSGGWELIHLTRTFTMSKISDWCSFNHGAAANKSDLQMTVKQTGTSGQSRLVHFGTFVFEICSEEKDYYKRIRQSIG